MGILSLIVSIRSRHLEPLIGIPILWQLSPHLSGLSITHDSASTSSRGAGLSSGTVAPMSELRNWWLRWRAMSANFCQVELKWDRNFLFSSSSFCQVSLFCATERNAILVHLVVLRVRFSLLSSTLATGHFTRSV